MSRCPPSVPDDVLVRHTAIGLNFIDVYFRLGVYPRALPFIPGREAIGIVEAAGANVTSVHPGERVGLHGITAPRAHTQNSIVYRNG